MLNNNYIYALRARERVEAFRNANIEMDTDAGFLDRWLNIKSLTNINDTKEWLFHEDITIDEFTYVIKPFDEFEKSILTDYVNKTDWYNELNRMLTEYKGIDSKRLNLKNNIAHVIGPFICDFTIFLTKLVESLSNVKVKESSISKIIDFVANDLSSYTIKVITWELHVFKEENPEFVNDLNDKSDGFREFIDIRYGNTEKLEKLYQEYPAMTRRIVKRLQCFKEHFKNAFTRIDKDYIEANQLFNINSNEIVDIDCGQGDSHQGGQSVLLITFSNKEKVLYKPKDLLIEKKFYEFLDWFNKNNKGELFEFKSIKALYRDNYSLTEFVHSSEADSIADVKKYYNILGQYLMLFYILYGNDMHLENIIANGDMPYIIDLETLFQDTEGIYQHNNLPEEKITEMIRESVLTIGILPFIGLTQNEEGKGVDISGLKGTSQILPFKVLKPKHVNTIDMVFEYDYAELKGAKNIPVLNGQQVQLDAYINDIMDGFGSMARFLINNKYEVNKIIGCIFGGEEIIVRLLLKATANYAALNNYSNHPNYLKDMVVFEKLLENLMSFPYANKKVVISEIDSMHFNDIPIFFRNVNDKDLIDSFGKRYEDQLSSNCLEKSLKRLEEFNQIDMEKQMNYIKLSLGVLKIENENKIFEINNSHIECKDTIDYEKQLNSINKLLVDKIIYNTDKTDLNWAIIYEKTSSLSPLDVSLFEGISGLGTYFFNLYKYNQKKEYKIIYEQIKNKIMAIPNKIFLNSKELLTAHYFLSLVYQETAESIIEDKIKIVLALFYNIQKNFQAGRYNIEKNYLELVYLSKCLVNMHKLTGITEARDAAEVILGMISNYSNNKFNLHAYQILSSVESYLGKTVFDGTSFSSYLKEVLQQDTVALWKSQFYDTYKNGLMMPVNCLLNEYWNSGSNSPYKKAKGLMDITLSSFNENDQYRIFKAAEYNALSLYDGLTGIAYTILRLISPSKIQDAYLMNI